jgi:hypothetical protein
MPPDLIHGKGAGASDSRADAISTDAGARHLRRAWSVFKASPSVFVGATLLLFASWVALELAVVALYRFGVVPWLLLHLAFLIGFSGLLAGFHAMAQQAVDGKRPRLRDLASRLERGPSFLLASVIYGGAVVAGLALLVVPGIYIAVRFALFGHVLAARAVSAPAALRGAAALSSGRWRSVGTCWLAALALNLAGAALLGVGILVTFPVSLLATASVFGAAVRGGKRCDPAVPEVLLRPPEGVACRCRCRCKTRVRAPRW